MFLGLGPKFFLSLFDLGLCDQVGQRGGLMGPLDNFKDITDDLGGPKAPRGMFRRQVRRRGETWVILQRVQIWQCQNFKSAWSSDCPGSCKLYVPKDTEQHVDRDKLAKRGRSYKSSPARFYFNIQRTRKYGIAISNVLGGHQSAESRIEAWVCRFTRNGAQWTDLETKW